MSQSSVQPNYQSEQNLASASQANIDGGLSKPLAPSLSPSMMSPPNMGDGLPIQRSRPLSEISENGGRRSNRHSHHSSLKGNNNSRPNSEIKDDSSSGNKRLSAHIATITLNLNDYAAAVKRPASVVSTKSRDSLTGMSSPSGSKSPPPLPVRTDRNSVSGHGGMRAASISSIKEMTPESRAVVDSTDNETKEGHPILLAKRASLKPSPLGSSYADVAKSPPPSKHNLPPIPPRSGSINQPNDDSPRSSTESPLLPPTKPKPSWLRRASGTSAFRTKSKSPVLREHTLPASASLPPELPPRKGSTSSNGSIPPEVPPKISYASITAGPSRSRLGDGAGQPALSPIPSSSSTRENLNLRGRIAAWTSNAQSSTFQRSDSSNSLASNAPSSFMNAQQRLPASAQRMIGSAGYAVQKGWAGLRSRGVGGSISSLSGLGNDGSKLEAPRFSRKNSRDRTVSAQATMMTVSDGPILHDGVIVRKGGETLGKVFGRDVSESGKVWGTFDAYNEVEGRDLYEVRRRANLPAVVIRCVDYLEVWGPKEEGIFRISGRSSHIARLRKEFDTGADLVMVDCHPGDVDPHAVSGIFKSYLRELPTPLLTKSLSSRFEAAAVPFSESEDITSLLRQLPNANWFLLSDILKLLDLIPKHSGINRMSLHALMLSLGPSLNIPGNVLTALLERRKELFSIPPPESELDKVIGLIDFGDTSISPPRIPLELPGSSSTSPISSKRNSTSISLNDKARKSSMLPSKPSLTRLFGANLSGRKSSLDISSMVPTSPPQVDMLMDSPTLPSFESEHKDITTIPEQPSSSPNKLSSSNSDQHYPVGTVEARAKAFTPIADMYSSASMFKGQRNSGGTLSSSASVPAFGVSSPSNSEFGQSSINPASVKRRSGGSGTGFFGGSHSHGRSHSVAVGIRGEGNQISLNDSDEKIDNPERKSVRDTVRSMELLA